MSKTGRRYKFSNFNEVTEKPMRKLDADIELLKIQSSCQLQSSEISAKSNLARPPKQPSSENNNNNGLGIFKSSSKLSLRSLLSLLSNKSRKSANSLKRRRSKRSILSGKSNRSNVSAKSNRSSKTMSSSTSRKSSRSRRSIKSLNAIEEGEEESVPSSDVLMHEYYFDLKEYSPNEISLRVLDNRLQINAKHEHMWRAKTICRIFEREIVLPPNCDPTYIQATLNLQGRLTVYAFSYY